MRDETPCPRCGASVWWTDDRCPKCRYDMGLPNVREVGHPEMRAELDRRYRASRDAAVLDGRAGTLDSFHDEVASESRAVINAPAKDLARFFEDESTRLSNYEHQTAGETRRAAKMKQDRDRRTVGARLFGDYAEEIRYAALSLDGEGLVSYAPCTIQLDDMLVANAGTVLEENSYTFMKDHRLLVLEEVPMGYQALWEERGKLAAIKHEKDLKKATRKESYSSVPRSGVRAVGNWPAAATLTSLAAAGQLSTAAVTARLR